MAWDGAVERDELSAEIALLKRKLPFKLRERWKALYGTEPPPRASCDLIKHAVAYRIQERLFGGLSVSTRRLLERVAKDAVARRPARVAPMRGVNAGAILLREWGGIQHQVTVLENGVLFRGKEYHSLSEVARIITGSRRLSLR